MSLLAERVGPGPARDLTALLQPRSVALVGATDRSNWTIATLANLRRFSPEVRVELVHPRRTTVLGRPVARSLEELPEPVDLAFVMAPREHVPDIVREAGACGVGGVVVVTAGFGETPDGLAWHRALVGAAEAAGVPVLGPNGSGFVDVRRRIAPFGLTLPAMPDPGTAAFVLHSGGLIKPVLSQARAWGVGVDVVVGTGNEAVLTATDVARHVFAGGAGAIGLFLEGFRQPSAFLELARQAAEADRPLVVLPVGRSEAARRGAAAHTGTLAGDTAVTAAVLRECGAVAVSTLEDLIATTGLLARGFRPRGNRIAVVGASGGAVELIADAAAENGLVLPPFGDSARAAVTAELPGFSTVANPLDVTGQAVTDPELPIRVMAAVADPDAVDAVLFQAFVTPPDRPPDAERVRTHFTAVARRVAELDVPVLLQDEVPVGLGDFARDLFGSLDLQRLPGVDIGLRAVARAVRYVAGRTSRSRPPDPFPGCAGGMAGRPAPAGRWSEPQALAALAAFGLPVVPHTVARDATQAARAAIDLPDPYVLKVVSPDIAHKSDVGGVRLNVPAAAVAETTATLLSTVRTARPDARVDGVLVAPQRSGGLELIVGLHRDPVWGPVLMIGAGGVFVEILGDVALHPLAVGPPDVGAMLGSLTIGRLLAGTRGRRPAGRESIVAAVEALVRAALAWDDSWQSIEVNPLWVDGDVVEALDALVVPSDPARSESPASGRSRAEGPDGPGAEAATLVAPIRQ